MKLGLKAFSLAFGFTWGLGLFFLAWWIMLFEGITRERTIFGQIYRGFRVSPLGSIWGLLWGFIDGFVGGAFFAWMYNRFSAKRQYKNGPNSD